MMEQIQHAHSPGLCCETMEAYACYAATAAVAVAFALVDVVLHHMMVCVELVSYVWSYVHSGINQARKTNPNLNF